jgi:hypothetical protein
VRRWKKRRLAERGGRASDYLDGGDARAKLAILALAGLHSRVAP